MKTRLSLRLFLACAALLGAALACSIPTTQNNTPQSPDAAVQTAAARTLEALRTSISQTGSTSTSHPGEASPTAQSATLAPSSTPLSSGSTPVPSATPQGTITKTLQTTTSCDLAGFISDLSIPDGTSLPAGSAFTKSWRLRNNGTCTWTTDYAIAFDSGNAMSGPASFKLAQAVAPGSTVDISVALTTPKEAGSYRGNWLLRNANGVLFGTGSNNLPFYVDIKVIGLTPSSNGYEFANNYCSAEWTTGSKTLTCPGTEGSSDGFVVFKTNPVLETGYTDDEPSIITNPPYSSNSVIKGVYPLYAVKSGDHFRTILGCAFDSKNCSVRFELDTQAEDGTVTTLQTWNETYDNSMTKVDVDLSSLAGKTVHFILKVSAVGSGNVARAQWLRPRIVQP